MAGTARVKSVEKVFAILEQLSKRDYGVTELALEVNLHKSTVHHILRTLLDLGYVSQHAETGKYGLS